MKRERKIYDPAFKTKAVQLSNERTNISNSHENSELQSHYSINGVKSTKNLVKAAFLVTEI